MWVKPDNSPKAGWFQSEQSMAAWIHSILAEKNYVPGHPPLLKQHHPLTCEASTHPTKKSRSSENFTQFNTLQSEQLHAIDTWSFSISHHYKFKKVLVQITQKNPLLRSTSSTSCLTTLRITRTSARYGRTDNYPLIQPYATAYGYSAKPNRSLSKVI